MMASNCLTNSFIHIFPKSSPAAKFLGNHLPKKDAVKNCHTSPLVCVCSTENTTTSKLCFSTCWPTTVSATLKPRSQLRHPKLTFRFRKRTNNASSRDDATSYWISQATLITTTESCLPKLLPLSGASPKMILFQKSLHSSSPLPSSVEISWTMYLIVLVPPLYQVVPMRSC